MAWQSTPHSLSDIDRDQDLRVSIWLSSPSNWKIEHVASQALCGHCVLCFDFVCHWTLLPVARSLSERFMKVNFQAIRYHLCAKMNSYDGNASNFYELISETLTLANTLFVPRVRRHKDYSPFPCHIYRLIERHKKLYITQKLFSGPVDGSLFCS